MTLLLAGALAFALVRLTLPPFLRLLVERGQVAANHRGRLIPVGAGLAPAVAAGAVAAAGGGPVGGAFADGVLGFALLGLLDDTLGDRSTGGLAGHLGALASGRLTTGAVKAVGGVLLALAVAAGRGGGVGRVLLDGFVMALAANAVNLLDLRPGRALKAVLAVGLPLFLAMPQAVTAALLGAAAAALPEDLGGRAMLGDVGANALGFGLGFGLAALPGGGAWAALAALVALHIYTERRSLTETIDRVAWLRFLDRLGRRDV